MNRIKLFTLFTLLLGYTAMMSCGNRTHNHDQTEQHNHDDDANHDHEHDDDAGHDHDGENEAHGPSAEYTSAYVCPMHCDKSGSDQAGKCPACGMDYVALAEHTKDGHHHHE